ncbi:MAG: heliorhodopsin HeR, partial [Methanobacteriota archaeon]
MNYKERRKMIADSPISFSYLKRFNTAAGILHLIQGILMLSLGLFLTWTQDIYVFYLKFRQISPGPPPEFLVAPEAQVLFTIGFLGVILATFPLISAIAHFTIAYPKNKRYNEYLKKGMNPYRWYEYALSSSIMIVLIGMLLGVWDLWS